MERVALGLVLGVLAGLVASGAVALIALLAILGCMTVVGEVWPKKGDEGSVGHCSDSMSSAGLCVNTPLPPV